MGAFVVGVAGLEDVFDVLLCPVSEGGEGLTEGVAECGEFVLNSWWHLVVHGAEDNSVALEVAQGFGEDLSADAIDGLAESAEPQWPML